MNAGDWCLCKTSHKRSYASRGSFIQLMRDISNEKCLIGEMRTPCDSKQRQRQSQRDDKLSSILRQVEPRWCMNEAQVTLWFTKDSETRQTLTNPSHRLTQTTISSDATLLKTQILHWIIFRFLRCLWFVGVLLLQYRFFRDWWSIWSILKKNK